MAEIDLPKFVRTTDVEKMIAALDSFRGDRWWFQTENANGEGRCLAPLVMHNMLLGIEAGTHEPSVRQLVNALQTALFYERKCRELSSKLGARLDAE